MKAVILASDFGLKNLSIPKALLDVGNKKLLDHFVEQLEELVQRFINFDTPFYQH